MAENRIIGLNGSLPWRLPVDRRHFKRTTMGKPLVMGRRTWDSIGRPLPGRTSIVVTRNPGFHAAGALVEHDLEAALARAEEIATRDQRDELMIIGGGEIFAATLERATRIYLTEIRLQVEGDIFYPALDADDWHAVSREDHRPVGNDTPSYAFVVLERCRYGPAPEQARPGGESSGRK